MKRALILLVIFSFVISASLSAQVKDFKGQSWVSGNFGYAFGTGDAFSSFNVATTKISTNAGVGFGGQYYYGVSPKWVIGGEIMFQSYSVEASTPANLALSIPASEVSVSSTETNFLFNSMLSVNQSKKSDLFLMGGTGLYEFGGKKLGFNTGLYWRTQVSPKVSIYGMPRVHIVTADATPMMFQLTMGAQFSL